MRRFRSIPSRRSGRLRGGLLAGLLALGLAGLALWQLVGGAEPAIRNLLLVTFDTTRADHLGCYGSESASTPHLDQLATEGVLFENCIAVTPITLPSHASILTGLYPFRHGVRNNATHHLPERIPTLAGSLSEAGIETGAVIAAVVLDSRYGLDRGFEHYDDDLSSAAETSAISFKETNAADTTRRALEWLEERGRERWFLWVHLFDPHASYQPPLEFAQRCGGSRYDGEIAYADEHLGLILARLRERGELDDTLVVMTADHGESLGEHGESTHSLFIYDATTRVPLILTHPSLARGRRIEEVVSLVDIVPTVLELLEVPSPGDLDGRSLAHCLLDPAATLEPAPVYSESMAPLYNHGWADLRAVRGDQHRYIRAPRPELYELPVDPGELDNLLPDAPDRSAPLEASLEGMLPEQEEDARGIDIAEVDPELRKSLAALGYTWSDHDGEGVPAAGRPDPKDRIEAWEKFLLGQKRITEGRPEEAERMLREVLAENPDSAEVSGALVKALIDQDRRREALEVLRVATLSPTVRGRIFMLRAGLEREFGSDAWRECLLQARALEPHDPQSWARQGEYLAEDGDLHGAIEAFEQALEVDGDYVKAWIGLGQARQSQSRLDEAAEAFQRAAEVDPTFWGAPYARGLLAEAREQFDEALRFYQEAKQRDSEQAVVHLRLGDLHTRCGRTAKAEASYLEALRVEPAHLTARYNLGVLYLQAGRREKAAEMLRAACEAREGRVEAWRKLAIACRACEEYQGLRLAAARLLERLPDDYQGLMASATADLKLGQKTAAAQALRRAFAVDPERVKQRAARDPELGALFTELGLE